MQEPIMSVENTKIPERWKSVLLEAMQYIKDKAPADLQEVYLFGSLARGIIKYTSDIDLCLVFKDSMDLRNKELVTFKGMLRSLSFEIPIDVVCCSATTFYTSDQCLFRNIRHDGRKLCEI